MRFAEPDMLWLLLALPLLAACAVWVARSRRRALVGFAGGARQLERFEGQVSKHRRAVKLLLIYGVLASIPLALARPQWGSRVETIEARGADVVIVLDLSLSMLAEDLPPNRLGHAKHAIGTMLDRLVGDRVGLVTFAGRAQLVCPLTADHAALRLFLDALDGDAVGVPGTALAGAMRMAADTLRIDEPATDERDRAVVVFSDGEDHAGGSEEVLDRLAAADVKVYTVGCGTPEGAPIPLSPNGGRVRGYKKDREDRVVTSRIDETLLRSFADRTDGRYVRATTAEVELDRLVESLRGLESGASFIRSRRAWAERFQLVLALGLLALLVETLLGDRRGQAVRR